jgi:hypothetical protein
MFQEIYRCVSNEDLLRLLNFLSFIWQRTLAFTSQWRLECAKAILTYHINRTLKPGGVYIVITYGAPDARLSHFQEAKLGWKVEIETVRTYFMNISHIIFNCWYLPSCYCSAKAYAELDKEKPNDVHYVYIATKNPIPVVSRG